MIKKRNSAGPGLVIGVPTLGRPVPLAWAFAFKSLSTPINYNTIFQVVEGQPVADARNQIAKYAVEVDAKYLFFLGDDVEVPAYTLKQLIHRMEQDPTLAVVGGVYCSKCEPSAPLVFIGNGQGSFWDWKIGDYFEVTGMGMDCTLIRVSALKDIPEPWFKTVDEDGFLDGKNSAESWTEDLYFFNKLIKLEQWKVYCDAQIICKHWDVYENKPYGLPVGSLPLRQMVSAEKKALLYGEREVEFEGTVVKFGQNGDSHYTGTLDALPFNAAEFDRIILAENPYSASPEGLDKNLLIRNELARVAKPGVVIEWLV